MLTTGGVKVIDCKTAVVTVRVALPVNPPNVAAMVEVPTDRDVANPVELTVAAEVLDELQIGEGIACEVPSE